MNPQQAFLDLLIAAMMDAAIELKLTQLKTQIDPDGKGLKYIRIIVVPEQMEYELPGKMPFGSVGRG
jgi:hypothetical protein